MAKKKPKQYKPGDPVHFMYGGIPVPFIVLYVWPRSDRVRIRHDKFGDFDALPLELEAAEKQVEELVKAD